ncbi:hypothetical protein [Microbacterium panaciterrae]|uniref:Carbohydrate kinase PfkB domain-containing protein n=1 Tax=Microbacterium panaciterrae TaxID=985759 RepID=A0ABP8P2F2_9MICO
MTERQVAILGEVRIDEIRDPGGVRETVAGDPVELAHALRGHGLVVTIIAPVGDDADGERIRAVLRGSGIHLVALPALEGTPRRVLVRDRSGAEIERGRAAVVNLADTRRSLAAQAGADVIVDLRGEHVATLAEDRDDVLRALGLLDPSAAPAEAIEGTPDEEPLSTDIPAPTRTDTMAAPGSPRLLPAPIVAGTVRHSPVRLVPPAPIGHAPVEDGYALDARIARIAT